MINEQKEKYDSYNRIRLFNSKYASDLASILEYAAEQLKFDTAVEAIKKAGGAQQNDGGGNAAASDTAKKAMSKTIVKYAKRGAVKARIAADTQLTASLVHPYSYIYSADKTTAVLRAGVMRNVMNDNLLILTNITPANILDIDTVIAAYEQVKDNPIAAKQEKKASGTDKLPKAYLDADAALLNMYDLVCSYFDDEAHATMVDAMTLAKQILNTGIRHTSLEFTVLDENGNPLITASAKDMSNSKIINAADTGKITVPSHKAGHFHFIISAPAKTDVDLAVDVKQGMSNKFTVKLKAVL